MNIKLSKQIVLAVFLLGSLNGCAALSYLSYLVPTSSSQSGTANGATANLEVANKEWWDFGSSGTDISGDNEGVVEGKNKHVGIVEELSDAKLYTIIGAMLAIIIALMVFSIRIARLVPTKEQNEAFKKFIDFFLKRKE